MNATASARIRCAADVLLDARSRQRRASALPDLAAPRTAGEAYAIQDTIVEALGPVAGWKVGAKSATAKPTCAPLCRAWLVPSPASFAAASVSLNGIEAELAFTLSRDLPHRRERYTAAELAASIAAVHPAIEVVESRYTDFRAMNPLSLLADFLSHGALVVGPGISLPAGFDVATQTVELDIDDARAATAVGSNPAGDPFRLLAWLAGHVAARRGGLRAGDIVTTGSWTGLRFVPNGAQVTARFPGIGEARAGLG